MKVEIVSIQEFVSSIVAIPGDTVRVSHVVGGVEHKKSEQEIPEAVVWTHSILFKLNDTLNHVIGDQATIDWLESQV